MTKQTFAGLSLSGDMIRAIGRVIEVWNVSENAAEAEAISRNGFSEGWHKSDAEQKQYLEDLEAGRPDEAWLQVLSYTVGERLYTGLPENVESPGDLADWVDTASPTSIEAVVTVQRPLRTTVEIRGGSSWATVTADVDQWGSTPAKDWEPFGSADAFLDDLESAMASFVSRSVQTSASRVFLGHGHGSDWRILEEKMRAAGYEPQAFESSVAAGAVNIFVIDTAMRASSAAVLYLTPDDLTDDGKKRARQNVIHEIGYAQGVLGIGRVVVVQNEEVEMPSNLDGVTVVRVKTGGLFEKLDEVIEYLRKIDSM